MKFSKETGPDFWSGATVYELSIINLDSGLKIVAGLALMDVMPNDPELLVNIEPWILITMSLSMQL